MRVSWLGLAAATGLAAWTWIWAGSCSGPAQPESCLTSTEACPVGTYCDPLTQRCVDEKLGQAEHCRTATNCQDSARPLCPAGYCVPCTAVPTAEAADQACQALGQARGEPELRTCVREGARKGQCGECRPGSSGAPGFACNSDGKHPDRPICDSGTCRPCQLHRECTDSGLCNDGSGLLDATLFPGIEVGQCASAAQVLFVDSEHCPPSGTGAEGTRERPFCDLQTAAAHGRYLVVLPRPGPSQPLPYPPLVLSDGIRRVVVGPGRDAGPLLSSAAVSKAGTALTLVDLELDSPGSGAALSCTAGARLSVIRSIIDLSSKSTVGIDASGCDRIEVAESLVTRSQGPAIRVAGTTRSYRIVNSLFSNNLGPSAIQLSAAASGQFAFNTLVNNGILSGPLAQDGGAVSCEAGAQPLLTDSMIVQNGRKPGSDGRGFPLGTQFLGPCRLQRVVVGQDAAASSPADGQAIAAIPDLDSRLRLLDTPNNASCCIDKAGPCQDLPTDFFGAQRPLGKACDIGAHELR